MNPAKLRKIHRKIAPIIFIPLTLSALTGIAYRVGRTWFKIPSDIADIFLIIHQGEYLGEPLVPIYILLVGLGLIAAIITGLTQIKLSPKKTNSQKTKQNFRKIHQTLAPIVFLPLFVTALTGISYRLGKTWFNLPKEQTKLLLSIHQGTYFGKELRVFYILFIGISLILMLITGINMINLFNKPSQQTKE